MIYVEEEKHDTMNPTTGRQLEALYRREADRLIATLSRKLGRESAEDIVSRAFIRLADKLEQGTGSADAKLLQSIIDGLVKNHWRDTASREIPVGTAEDVWASGHPETIEDVEFRHDFDLALRHLPEQEREAFILTELRGLTVREAASLLGVHWSTVHRRAEAARTSIAKELS